MFHVSNLIAKFVAFWITFVVAKIIVVAQTSSNISIIKSILGESITVGVIMIFAYFLMKEFQKALSYNQKRDERLEDIMQRDIEFREKQIQSFREQTEAFRRLHESIDEIKAKVDERNEI